MLVYKTILKDIIKFSIPVLFGLIGTILISTGDTIIAAQYSTASAAALSVAGGFQGIIFLFGIGLSQGLSPRLSHKLGKEEEIESLIFSLIIYGFLIGTTSMIMFLLVVPWLSSFGFPVDIVYNLRSYLLITAFSNPFAFIFITVKEYYQVHNKVFYPNLISVLAVGVNLLFNWLLAFGKFGFPEMGLDGIAVCTIIVRIFMVVLLLYPLIKKKLLTIFKCDFKFLKNIFYFSLPIAFTQLFESSAFSMVSIFVGRIGQVESAANGIAFNIIALTFMVPLTISIAMTVRIGRFYGSNNINAIFKYIKVGVVITLMVMASFIFLMLLVPRFMMGLYSHDPKVIELGISILFICSLFQLFDGMQCLGAFVLRGLNISRPAMYISFIAFWVVAIPLGILFAETFSLGVIGYWSGLVAGLLIAALGYWVFVIKTLRQLAISNS